MKRLGGLFFVFSLFLMMTTSFAHAQDDDLVDQTIFLTFIPNIQFAPVYAGIANSHFADNGINLDILHGDEPDGVNLVAANELQFGIFGGEQVILARANERPVVYVYEWFQKFPNGIVTPVDSGIETVADLVGRKVGIPGRFGTSYSGLIALLAANDLQESDIELEPIGFNATEVVCVGGVEASMVFINNEPLQIEQRCTDVRVIRVSEFADLVSNGLVTNEMTIAENPELVQAMVNGFDAGLRDVINNPAEAYLLSADFVENLPLDVHLRAALEEAAFEQNEFLATNPDRNAIAASRVAMFDNLKAQFDGETLLQFEVLLASIDLWDAEQLGATDIMSWQITQDTLIFMTFLDEPLPSLEAAFTNEFLLRDNGNP
ncbi:MAG: hypothetical protein D6737_20640 [Chloroflexi bacterium]|nr:MAG: hypothetical protein D6737_20640 [Chloroflexota bacterium]